MINVKVLTPQDWKVLAENAHLVVFDETWDKELERISFALLMIDEKDVPISYATAQEVDENTVYLQYGGAFPSYKGSATVYRSFEKMLQLLRSQYKVVKTYVENDNYPMLKFYMKNNFCVTGIRYFKDAVLLENSYEC